MSTEVETTKDIGELKDDLIGWDKPEDIPNRLRELPRKFGLTARDCGLRRSQGVIMSEFKSRDEKAGVTIHKVTKILLNLMRLESGLKPTDKPVSEWPRNELEGSKHYPTNWGSNARDTVSTAKPRRKGGTVGKPALSPDSGWHFRMVEKYGPTIFSMLVFAENEIGRRREDGLKCVEAAAPKAAA
jgi:hypothetical protein